MVFQQRSSHMPSVTFCIWVADIKDLNSFFGQTEFSTQHGFRDNLTGEQFHEEGFGDCI